MFVLTASFQELFDTAVRGLAGQGFERSMDPGGDDACAYRGAGGRKCALGHLLTDEELASLSADSYSVNTYAASALRTQGGKYLLPVGSRFRFVTGLQGAHDRAERPGSMPRNLRRFAEDNNLNTTVLDELTKAVKP